MSILGNLPIFATFKEVDEHIKNAEAMLGKQNLGDQVRLHFFGRLICAMKWPHLFFKGVSEGNGFALTRTNPRMCKIVHPDVNQSHLFLPEASYDGDMLWSTHHLIKFMEFYEIYVPKSDIIKKTTKVIGVEEKDSFYRFVGKLYGVGNCNLVIMTGIMYGVTCLDLDTKVGIANYNEDKMVHVQIFEKLCNSYGYTMYPENKNYALLPVPQEGTKSGGRHLYFNFCSSAKSKTKCFTLIDKTGKSWKVDWDILNGNKMHTGNVKSTGFEPKGKYEWVIPPFNNEVGRVLCDATSIEINDKAHPELLPFVFKELVKAHDSDEDLMLLNSGALVHYGQTHWLHTLFITRTIIEVEDENKNTYYKVKDVEEADLKQYEEEKEDNNTMTYRVDQVINSIENYEKYVIPILETIPDDQWYSMLGYEWRTLIYFICRVVDRRNKKLVEYAIEDFVVRCRKYKQPDDDQVRAEFRRKDRDPALMKKANHEYVIHAVLQKKYHLYVRDLLQLWNDFLAYDWTFEFVESDDNLFNLRNLRLPVKIDRFRDIYNEREQILYFADFKDGFNFGDHTKFNAKTPFSFIVKWMKHTLAYLSDGTGKWYVKKLDCDSSNVIRVIHAEHKTADFEKSMKSIPLRCKYYETEKGERKKLEVTLWDVVNIFRPYVTYDLHVSRFKWQYTPYNLGVSTLLNSCFGYIGKHIDYKEHLTPEEITAGVSNILRVITYLCGAPDNYEDPKYKLFLDLMSSMIQNPEMKEGIIPCFISSDGDIGKSTFIFWFLKHVIGMNNSMDIKLNSAFENYTGDMLDGKQLVIINEFDKSATTKFMENLKNISTETEIGMRGIYGKHTTVRNFSRIWCTGNRILAIAVKDRRLLVMHPVKVTDLVYIARFDELFKNEKSHYYGGVFYNFLNTRKIETKNFPKALQSMTKTIEDERSRRSTVEVPISVIMDLIEGDIDSDCGFTDILFEGERKITSQKLYELVNLHKPTTYGKITLNEISSVVESAFGTHVQKKRSGGGPTTYHFGNWKKAVEYLFTSFNMTQIYQQLINREEKTLSIMDGLDEDDIRTQYLNLHNQYHTLDSKTMSIDELKQAVEDLKKMLEHQKNNE